MVTRNATLDSLRMTVEKESREPTRTSDFVRAGFFKNRGDARKVLRELARHCYNGEGRKQALRLWFA